MGDVLEYLIDGTSGLAPGGVEGSCIVAGVCSLGNVGKGYLLGKSSDLNALLGSGPLVDRLRDIFATGGQNPRVIAVPITGTPGGYIAGVEHTGTGPEGVATGVAAENADVVVEIVTGGELETAEAKVSTDGGSTFDPAAAVPANGQITIGATGVTVTLGAGIHISGDTYEFAVRNSIGPVEKTGAGGPEITLAGTVKAAAEVILQIISSGALNEATYQLSLDGDSFGPVKTVPLDGIILAGDTGVTITVAGGTDLVAGVMFECRLLAPAPSITSVMTALEQPLSLYDVEFVYIGAPSDSIDWAAMGVKADELWNAHRPTFFVCEARLPWAGEDLNEWTAAMIEDKQGYAHRFVSVCAAFGEVTDTTGSRIFRNWAGLMAGRILSIPVMRATGRVRDSGISQGSLPDDFTSAMQQTLESAGFATAKHYAGLNSAYWEIGRASCRERVLRLV